MKTGLFRGSQKTFHSWFRLGGPGSGAGLDLGMRGREDARTWPHTWGPADDEELAFPSHGNGGRGGTEEGPGLTSCHRCPSCRAWSPGPRGRQGQLLTSRLGPLGASQLIRDGSGSHLARGAGIRTHGENTDHPSEQMAGCLLTSVSGAGYILK